MTYSLARRFILVSYWGLSSLAAATAFAQSNAAHLAPVVAPDEYTVTAKAGALESRITELEAQLEAQAREQEEFRTALDAATARPAEEIRTPPGVEVGKDKSLKGKWDNGFIFETPNKDFRMQIGGRTQFDAVW